MRYLLLSIAFSLLGLLIYIAFTTANRPRENVSETKEIIIRDTVYVNDTVLVTKLEPKNIIVKEIDTVYTTNGDTLELKYETNEYVESVLCGTDTINARIVTSGIKSSVDSLSLILRKKEITNTITVEKVIKQHNRFHISPNVSFGYGIWSKRPDMYIGIGVSYDL